MTNKLSDEYTEEWWKEATELVERIFPQPKDQRAYLVAPLINAILAGHNLTDANRSALKEYPTLIKLLDRYAQIREDEPHKRNSTISFTLGPEATVESLAQSQLDWLDHVEKYKKFGFKNGLSIKPPRFEDSNYPGISADVVGDPVKWQQFLDAKQIYEEWITVEENRRWRQAYKQAQEPVPEQYGIPTPGDHIPFERPEKVIIR